jgi:hypothetical protein
MWIEVAYPYRMKHTYVEIEVLYYEQYLLPLL